MEQLLDCGRLLALFVVASALALLGYSVGYQFGHSAGLERMDRQLDMLAKLQVKAVLPAEMLDGGAAEAASDTR